MSETGTSLTAKNWTIAIDATVSSPDGEAPFALQVESPVVLSDLTHPTTLTIGATAGSPVLVVFSAEVLTARLRGPGILDVVGPGCPSSYNFADAPDCSADPAMLTIGVTYPDLTGPKPTGSVISSTSIPLVLITDALRPGTYHLADSGSWKLASDGSFDLHRVDIAIDFTVTGPT